MNKLKQRYWPQDPRDQSMITIVLLSYLPLLQHLFENGLWQVAVLHTISGTVYISLFWLILTGFRVGWLRDLFSTNFMNTFHKTLAPMAFTLILLHPLGFALLYADWRILIPFLHPYGTLISLGGIALSIFIINMIASFTLRKVNYQLWKFMHAFNYLLIVIVYFHSQQSVRTNTLLGIYFAILLLIAMLSAVYKFSFDLKLFTKKVKVLSVDQAATNTYNLTLQTTPLQSRAWKPGQYVMLSINLFTDNHPFSISRLNPDGTVEVTFKIFGDFTKKLSQLKADQIVKISGPYGQLGNGLDTITTPLVFIAGGIGITPFRSMIYQLLSNKDQRQIFLVFAANDVEALGFNAEFQDLANKYTNFHYLPVVRNNAPPEFKQGYVTVDMIKEFSGDLMQNTFYVCGPPAMMKIITKQLTEAGVEAGRIRSENFGY